GWTADDPADVVHAGLETREPDHLEATNHRRHLLDRHPPELDLLARRHVGDVPAALAGYVGDQSELASGEDAGRHPNAQHAVARRGPAEEDARPFQAFLVVVAVRPPGLAREASEVLGDLESVARGLDGLDLVHALHSSWRRKKAPGLG